jgi:hypothetical protein
MNHMTNAETNDKAATVAEQGGHVAPAKASSKKQATAQKGALKARTTASVKPKKDAPRSPKHAREQKREGAGVTRSHKRSRGDSSPA